MTPTQLHPYTGILILDNNKNRSYLRQRDALGNTIDCVMMLDTPPSGEFDEQRILDAWRFFSTLTGIGNGSTITIYGFWAYPPNSIVPVLHVVRF